MLNIYLLFRSRHSISSEVESCTQSSSWWQAWGKGRNKTTVHSLTTFLLQSGALWVRRRSTRRKLVPATILAGGRLCRWWLGYLAVDFQHLQQSEVLALAPYSRHIGQEVGGGPGSQLDTGVTGAGPHSWSPQWGLLYGNLPAVLRPGKGVHTFFELSKKKIFDQLKEYVSMYGLE